jgi:hypothetical protein
MKIALSLLPVSQMILVTPPRKVIDLSGLNLRSLLQRDVCHGLCSEDG